MKDSISVKANDDRPYSPPFSKLTSIENNLINKQSSNIPDDINKIIDDDKPELMYDHVLGCYYDPKTNIYYELKDN